MLLTSQTVPNYDEVIIRVDILACSDLSRFSKVISMKLLICGYNLLIYIKYIYTAVLVATSGSIFIHLSLHMNFGSKHSIVLVGVRGISGTL